MFYTRSVWIDDSERTDDRGVIICKGSECRDRSDTLLRQCIVRHFLVLGKWALGKHIFQCKVDEQNWKSITVSSSDCPSMFRAIFSMRLLRRRGKVRKLLNMRDDGTEEGSG